MKRLAFFLLCAAALAVAGCSTVNINVGDAAILAASGCGTNAVVATSSSCGTNTLSASGSASILINVTMNVPKDIKPDSTLTLAK
jgi:activator of HSP90 ATPase